MLCPGGVGGVLSAADNRLPAARVADSAEENHYRGGHGKGIAFRAPWVARHSPPARDVRTTTLEGNSRDGGCKRRGQGPFGPKAHVRMPGKWFNAAS